MWDDQFNVFAQGYTVVRYDVRGFGDSENPAGSFSHVDDLHSLLRDLDIDRTALLGLSMGGNIAIDYTLQYPEAVEALIAVGTPVNGFDEFTDATVRVMSALDAAVESEDLEEAAKLSVHIGADGPLRTADQVDPAFRQRLHELARHQLSRRSSQGREERLGQPAISRLSEIHVPTLIVVGELDWPELLGIADLLEAGISGAIKVVMPGAAHHVNMERPQDFNRIVLGFLAQPTSHS